MLNSVFKWISVVLVGLVIGFGAVWLFVDDETETVVEHQIDEVLENSEAVRDKNVDIIGNGQDTVTILVYMNGSNLESDDGEASSDLQEMVAAGSNDNVNVIVQTMGTKKWKKFGIASDRSQIYEVNGDGLTLVKDDLGQLDCTDPNSLSGFIKWGTQNYPANRYILQFWDHGSGPVLGFGYDEYNEEGYLSTDEIQSALQNAGVYFDWIGMDCCIMSSVEIGCALYDYCDYLIVSEDFEPGIGWYYTDWLKALRENPSISTPDLSKIIIDTMVSENAKNPDGGEAILSCLDVSMMKVLFQAWTDFAYANEDALLDTNYSQETTIEEGGRLDPRFYLFEIFEEWFGSDNVTLDEYYITDLMAVAQNIESDESKALSSAIAQTMVYSNCTEGDMNLTGIAVTLPYGDSDYYSILKTVFSNCGIDNQYIKWLNKFTSVTNTSYYDYGDWEDIWSGWDDYDDDYDWDDWYGWDEYDDEYWDDWGFSNFDHGPHHNSNSYYNDHYYREDDYYDDYDYYDDLGYYDNFWFDLLFG